MLRGGATDSDRLEFLRESETMLDIGSHLNIVSMIGVVVSQRPWLVVLEFCIYGDLLAVLTNCRRKKIDLTLQEKLFFAEQIVSGMKYVASKKYVHMDLAARNCLISENNLIKVADFGLTHKFNDGLPHYKQNGVMKLSIRWLDLNAYDCKVFSEKSDVWSFGVTMWEIFSAGEQPYKNIQLVDVLKVVRKGYRLTQPESAPGAVYELMLRCWESNYKKRPSFSVIFESIRYACPPCLFFSLLKVLFNACSFIRR